jgi:hypothetical protein
MTIELQWQLLPWERELDSQKRILMVLGLYSFNGRHLSAELEELRGRVAGIERECTTEAVQLS